MQSPGLPARLTLSALVAVGGLLTLAAGPAAAHIGASVDEVEAGKSATVGFAIGHGCDGSPTTALAFQVPEGVVNAKPNAHPGWDIVVEREQLATPVEQPHGDPLMDRPAVIRFTAQPGSELPNDVRDVFEITFTAPDTVGEALFFPVVQSCAVGETPWIEQWDGQGEEPEHPAPSVAVAAASDDTDDTDDHEGAEVAHVADVAASDAQSGDDSDDGGNGLAIVGIVLGGLGLVAGGVALARSRRPAAG